MLPDRQRERHRRHHRDPVRRQRPARRAGRPPRARRPAGAAQRRRRPLRRQPGRRPGRTLRRRRRRGRPTSTPSGSARPARAGLGTGGMRDQGRGGPDRHRRRHPGRADLGRATPRPRWPASRSARCSTRPAGAGRPGCCGWPTPPSRAAGWCSTPAPCGPWSSAAPRCSPPASPASTGDFVAGDPVDLADPDGRPGRPRAGQLRRRRAARRCSAARRTTSSASSGRRTSARSCTATTWCCCEPSASRSPAVPSRGGRGRATAIRCTARWRPLRPAAAGGVHGRLRRGRGGSSAAGRSRPSPARRASTRTSTSRSWRATCPRCGRTSASEWHLWNNSDGALRPLTTSWPDVAAPREPDLGPARRPRRRGSSTCRSRPTATACGPTSGCPTTSPRSRRSPGWPTTASATSTPRSCCSTRPAAAAQGRPRPRPRLAAAGRRARAPGCATTVAQLYPDHAWLGAAAPEGTGRLRVHVRSGERLGPGRNP